MRLNGLAIRHFRNLGSQDLELPSEGVALIGDNAQGKSNFLEAIYYLETSRSFRGARDEQLVAFHEGVFRVAGTLQERDTGRSMKVAAAFEKKGKRKKVSVDGAEPDRMGDVLGRLAAVIFSPADVELVSGGPRERRRFLDIVLSLSEPGYLTALLVKLLLVGLSGAAAAIHSTTRSAALRGATGALGALAALGALFAGAVLVT